MRQKRESCNQGNRFEKPWFPLRPQCLLCQSQVDFEMATAGKKQTNILSSLKIIILRLFENLNPLRNPCSGPDTLIEVAVMLKKFFYFDLFCWSFCLLAFGPRVPISEREGFWKKKIFLKTFSFQCIIDFRWHYRQLNYTFTKMFFSWIFINQCKLTIWKNK